MSVLDRAALAAAITEKFAKNGVGAINADTLRTQLSDLVDSAYNKVDDQGVGGGSTISRIAGGTFAAHLAVGSMLDGRVAPVSSNAPDQWPQGAIGVAKTAAATAGVSLNVSTNEPITDPAWAGWPVQSAVFVGFAGQLTLVVPTTGFVQQIGTVTAPGEVTVSVERPTLISGGTVIGPGSSTPWTRVSFAPQPDAVAGTRTDVLMSPSLTAAQADGRSVTIQGVTDTLPGHIQRKQNALGFTPVNAAVIGQPSGVADLGPDGKVPSSRLPVSGSPKGPYNAATNTPAITSGSGNPGDYYIVSVAGTVAADSVGPVNPGDQIVRGTTAWGRIPSFVSVASLSDATTTGKGLLTQANNAAVLAYLGLDTALAAKAPSTLTPTGAVTAFNILDLLSLPELHFLTMIPYARAAEIRGNTCTTDLSAALNSALASAVSAGKPLRQPRGTTPFSGGIQLPGGVVWLGEDKQRTIIKALPGSNPSTGSYVQTQNADQLWGATPYSSQANSQPWSFEVENIKLDGNFQPGNGFRCLGLGNKFRNVTVVTVGGHGFWKRFLGFSPTTFIPSETWSQFVQCSSDSVGMHGWFWDGETDTDLIACKAVESSRAAHNTYDGFHVGVGSNFKGVNLHAYSETYDVFGSGQTPTTNRPRAGIYTDVGSGGCNISNAHFEGAVTASIIDQGDGHQFTNVSCYARRGPNGNPYTVLMAGTNGRFIGTVTSPTFSPNYLAAMGFGYNGRQGAYNTIDMFAYGNDACMLDWTNSGGGNSVRMSGATGGGFPTLGTPAYGDEVFMRAIYGDSAIKLNRRTVGPGWEN